MAFALLGIEGAATECENPFSPKRTNHLGMDRFCLAQQDEVCQLLRWWKEDDEENVEGAEEEEEALEAD